MKFIRDKWCLGILFFLLFATLALAACPNGLSGNCKCSEGNKGFYIECREINSDLNSVLSSIEKIHVEHLVVTDAYLPVLKSLPKLSVRIAKFLRCGIEEIEESAFDPIAEGLEELVLANNSLTAIPKFGNMSRLLSLNLKFNQIDNVSDSAFNTLTKLSQLRLDGNKICSLSSNALESVRNTIELLDLSGNCMERVPANNLKNLPRLMYLDLSENRITSVEDFDFTNLPQLRELRLNDNKITEFTTLAFKDLPRLQYMYLQHNLLSQFDTSAMIEGFRRLEVIDISNNRLLEVPILKELPNIVQVNLECNKIGRIDNFTFSGNRRLRQLSLQNNEVSFIASHSFSRLHGLTHLLLGNNALRSLEPELFYGMQKLEQLSLHNNSLFELENHTFVGISSLEMLDLANNGLHKIATGAFKPLERLMWLDLSNNVLTTIEKDTFEDPIPNIILYGNPLLCDNKIEWLVHYLNVNRVRTHLPFQSEVMCAAPEKYVSVPLRKFIARKANETLSAMSAAFKMVTGSNPDQNVITNLIPAGLRKFVPALDRSEKNPYSNVPVIGAITETLPGLRNIPGLNYIPKVTGERVEDVQSLNNAIEKFSSPLVKVATGESESFSDIEQMVKAIPELAVNLPGVKDLDLSKLPSSVLLQVLRGEQIPGIEKKTLERILKNHTHKMYEAAVAANSGHPLLDETRYLPALRNLPKEIIVDMMKGGLLPYLTKNQMSAIKAYYMKKVVALVHSGKNDHGLPDGIVNPNALSLLKLLPPDYDLNKIPTEVLEDAAEGRIPNLYALPEDLKEYILHDKSNGASGKTVVSTDGSFEDLGTEPPVTFERYDINKVSVDLIKAEEEAARKARLRIYSTVLLCVVGIVSFLVLLMLFLYLRRKRVDLTNRKLARFGSVSTGRQPNELLVPLRNRSTIAGRPMSRDFWEKQPKHI